jgi:hypothetical protein
VEFAYAALDQAARSIEPPHWMEKIFSCPTIGDDQEKLMDILDRGCVVKSGVTLT